MNETEMTELCEIISKFNNAKDVERFLTEVLTPSELNDIIKRWDILKRLSRKEPQRTISKALAVSLCKVTRGAKILKNEKSIIRKTLFDESWRK